MYEIYAHSRQVRQRARALHQALVRGRRTKVVRQCLYGHCIFLFFRGHPKITLRSLRGHHFAYRSNQYRLQANRLQAVFSYKRRNGSPSILPLRHDKRSLTARGPFCSALALRRGTDHRFKRLVWASLHLSERSRTIEVRVTTLSPQTCTKSLA